MQRPGSFSGSFLGASSQRGCTLDRSVRDGGLRLAHTHVVLAEAPPHCNGRSGTMRGGTIRNPGRLCGPALRRLTMAVTAVPVDRIVDRYIASTPKSRAYHERAA